MRTPYVLTAILQKLTFGNVHWPPSGTRPLSSVKSRQLLAMLPVQVKYVLSCGRGLASCVHPYPLELPPPVFGKVVEMLHLPLWPHPNNLDLVLGRLWRSPISPLSRVTASARTAHMCVIGMSGKGKSKLLEHCLYQDISAGRGCGLIDPQSLLVDDLL